MPIHLFSLWNYSYLQDLQISKNLGDLEWHCFTQTTFSHFLKYHILWYTTSPLWLKWLMIFVQCTIKPIAWTYQIWWWTVWWFLPYSLEEVQKPPTLSQVLREDQMVSIRCLLNTQLSNWACNKLIHNNTERSHFIIFLCYLMLQLQVNQRAHVIILHKYYLPTPVTRTQEQGGLGDRAIAWARLFVVLMRLENKSFLKPSFHLRPKIRWEIGSLIYMTVHHLHFCCIQNLLFGQ